MRKLDYKEVTGVRQRTDSCPDYVDDEDVHDDGACTDADYKNADHDIWITHVTLFRSHTFARLRSLPFSQAYQ